MPIKVNIIFLIIVFIFGKSCKSDQTTYPEAPSNGQVKLEIKKENIPQDVKFMQVILQREDFSSITKTFDISNEQNFEADIYDIKIGIWKLSVFALDSLQKTLYEGHTYVEIFADNITVANVSMYPAEGNETGGLIVTVNWVSGDINSWQYYNNNPIVTKIGNDYDARGVVGSYVLKENSNDYKMWYFTYSSRPGGYSYIYYANSNDGLNWSRPSIEPALYMGEPGTWDSAHVGGQAVIKIDQQYVMYYTGWKNFNKEWSIGRAVSSDGMNWSKDPYPVLYGKDSTSWEYKIQVVDVEKINNVYYMYYHGKNGSYDHKIGLAFSNDGKTWQRHQNNPILEVSSLWEGLGVYYPSVDKVGDRYVMIYSNSGGPEQAFGLAYSNDGIVWEKDSNNPIFRTSDIGHSIDKVGYPQIIQQDSKEILYFSSFNLDGSKTINALIHPKE